MTPVLTLGPGRETVTFDDEFHDSVRRCTALRENLKLEAQRLAGLRGHKLGSWTSFDIDHWTTSCTACGSGLKVETTWPEIAGKATGTALTGDCAPPQ